MTRSIVVIGPSANGKSTLAAAIAARLGWRFIEGDEHHPPDNVAKMARGEPLNDADRQPFLRSIGDALAQAGGGVAACSALKRSYRDLLCDVAGEPVLFVLPQVPRDELQRRMEQRGGHFMPPSLLASQLADFEVPQAGEHFLLLNGALPAQVLAEMVADALGRD